MQGSIKERTMEQIYSYAPSDQVRLLEAFRARVDPTWTQGGLRAWSAGVGRRAMVFLPSGAGYGEIFFPYMLALQHDIRCVTMQLPPIGELDPMCEAIHAGLVELGIERVILVGSSLGGLIAQRYARLYPERVDAIVLLTTSAPTDDVPAEILHNRAHRRVSLRTRLFSFRVTKQGLASFAFSHFCPEPYRERMIFWEAYFEDIYQNQVYKKQHIALNTLLPASIYRQRWTPGDLASWGGAVLIYESDEDTVYTKGERDALRALYPNAEVHALTGGQFLPMVHEGELKDRLRKLATQRGIEA